MTTTRFQTYSSSCEITEDEIHLTKSRVTSLKRKIERKQKTSLFILVGSALLFVLIWIVNGSVTDGFLALGKFVVVPAIVIYVGVELFKFIRWEVAKRRHDSPEGGFVFAGTIPRNRIVSVGASRSEKGAIAVNFERDGMTTSGIMTFVDAESLGQAKEAFRTAGIPLEEV